MLKKPKTSKEEKMAEDYFPIDKADLERAIEIQVSKSPSKEDFLKRSTEKIFKRPDRNSLETIESPAKNKIKRKNSSTRKTSRKTSQGKRTFKRFAPKEYSPPKIELKSGGYELIITEKPQVALKISSALGNSKQRNNHGTPYYEVSKDGKNIVVACAVGHLFTLQQKTAGSDVPTFNISWTPNYLVRKNDFTKRYFDVIAKLCKNAGSVTVATDYDIE